MDGWEKGGLKVVTDWELKWEEIYRKKKNHKSESFTVFLFLADLRTRNIPHEQLMLLNVFSSKRPIMVGEKAVNISLLACKVHLISHGTTHYITVYVVSRQACVSDDLTLTLLCSPLHRGGQGAMTHRTTSQRNCTDFNLGPTRGGGRGTHEYLPILLTTAIATAMTMTTASRAPMTMPATWPEVRPSVGQREGSPCVRVQIPQETFIYYVINTR